ncbi:hypothetical protein IAU60_005826 [Kwoniella sp. DSM 27419]
MSLPPRSPSRKSLSLSEHNLNLDMHNVTLPVTAKDFHSRKGRAASLGGDAFQIGSAGMNDLSPRRKARRSMQPRKSILKPLGARGEENEETQQYAHTIAFSASTQSLLSRRVSFAPNAHVRMFEPSLHSKTPDGTPAAARAKFALPAPSTDSRSSGSHSRRSSITHIGSVSKPNIFAPANFVGEGADQGEESMDIEPDSDDFEEDEGVAVDTSATVVNTSIGTTTYVQETGSSDEEEDMDEDDMEMTQNIGGGIVRRSSMPAPAADPNQSILSEADTEINVSVRSEEEKTMDFTIAIGGLLPPQAPADARANRQSIGYSIPMPAGSSLRNILPGEAVEGEIEMEMEETVAFGGIIGPDDSISSASEDTMNGGDRERTMTFSFNHSIVPPAADEDDEGAMEMTIATGGILNLPHPQPDMSPARTPPFPFPATSPASRPVQPNPSGTPSFARSTVSSVQKSQKRNIFAPSPSPAKATTPKKTGFQVAGEVAKRLSFGSATGSVTKKRTLDEVADAQEEQTANAKKVRMSVTASEGEVFGTPVFQHAPISRSSLGRPRSSLGTPMRLVQSPAAVALPRVSFAPASLELVSETKGAEAAESLEEEQEWDAQTISLGNFLEMAGVQFMEGLPGLNRRRSSVAKGLLGQSYAGDRDFALHEYAEAQVNSIFLNMYNWAANKLRDDIKSAAVELRSFEERCDEDSPPVIQEYLSATDDDKQLFEMTFKSFKTNTHLKAKEMWYDWKLQLMETIQPDVQNMMAQMQDDNERLTEMDEQIERLLPDLKARQAALHAELIKEREVVAEIAACDQSELASFKEGITEMDAQIAVFKDELQESSTKLSTLKSKLGELNATKRDAVAAISHAKSQCDQFTRSDAIRLQEEYTSIQHLHLWRPTKVQANRLELEFDNEILVTLACREYSADLSTVQVEYLNDKVRASKRSCAARGSTPTPGLFSMVQLAVRAAAQERSYKTLPQMVQNIGRLWSTAQRLRAEVHYLSLRYPCSFAPTQDGLGLEASLTMMFPSVRSKIRMTFGITQEVLWGYPDGLSGTEVSIEQVYGKADVEMLLATARESMDQVHGQACVGAFLQTCIDVAQQHM